MPVHLYVRGCMYACLSVVLSVAVNLYLCVCIIIYAHIDQVMVMSVLLECFVCYYQLPQSY